MASPNEFDRSLFKTFIIPKAVFTVLWYTITMPYDGLALHIFFHTHVRMLHEARTLKPHRSCFRAQPAPIPEPLQLRANLASARRAIDPKYSKPEC